jgi:hypothetical protein
MRAKNGHKGEEAGERTFLVISPTTVRLTLPVIFSWILRMLRGMVRKAALVTAVGLVRGWRSRGVRGCEFNPRATAELSATTSPYIRRQIRRFGKYDLDMDDLPEPLIPRPLPFELPL